MNVIGEFFVCLFNNYFYFEKLLQMVLLLFVCLFVCLNVIWVRCYTILFDIMYVILGEIDTNKCYGRSIKFSEKCVSVYCVTVI